MKLAAVARDLSWAQRSRAAGHAPESIGEPYIEFNSTGFESSCDRGTSVSRKNLKARVTNVFDDFR